MKTFIIELFIHPTFDFRMELLKYGDQCEVLEPKKLRDEMKAIVVNLSKMYK